MNNKCELIYEGKAKKVFSHKDKDKVLELMDLIDSHDDVNQVFSNFSFSE